MSGATGNNAHRLPAEISIRQLAEWSGIPFRVLQDRAKRGSLRTTQPNGPGTKRVIRLNVLRRTDPDLWESILTLAGFESAVRHEPPEEE